MLSPRCFYIKIFMKMICIILKWIRACNFIQVTIFKKNDFLKIKIFTKTNFNIPFCEQEPFRFSPKLIFKLKLKESL